MTLILNTNLKNNNATTQYLMDINSAVKFNGKYFLSGKNGLYSFLGDTDNTNKISAYFITATMDFGFGQDKRLRYLYLSLESTGNLQVGINTEKISSIIYPIAISTPGQQDIRIPISRSLHGRFWTFKVGNGSSGADFSIDEMSVLPILKNRWY
jgi:hypothetical protein